MNSRNTQPSAHTSHCEEISPSGNKLSGDRYGLELGIIPGSTMNSGSCVSTGIGTIIAVVVCIVVGLEVGTVDSCGDTFDEELMIPEGSPRGALKTFLIVVNKG